MKLSNKQNVAVGTVLLLLAAFFSIALILQPLDFGAFGPGRDNVFYRLGDMLVSVYGFSSILIPSFLFVAALSCFASRWTVRKSMRLLTAVIPFFTSVIVEKICRAIQSQSTTEYDIIKIVLAAIIGLMLVVIEFLGVGVIADRMTGQSSAKNTKKKMQKTEQNTSETDEEDNTSIENNADENTQEATQEKQQAPLVKQSESDVSQDTETESSKDEEDDPFEGVFDNIDIIHSHDAADNSDINDSDEEDKKEVEDIYKTGLESIFADTQQKTDTEKEVKSNNVEDEQSKTFENNASENNVNANADADDDYVLSPASLITQEEYASLTNFDDLVDRAEDEIEQNDSDAEVEGDKEEDSVNKGDEQIPVSKDLLEWPETDEIMAQAGNKSSENKMESEMANASPHSFQKENETEGENKNESVDGTRTENEVEVENGIENEEDDTDYLYGDTIDDLYDYDDDELDEFDSMTSTRQGSDEDEGLKKNEKINDPSSEIVETVNLYEQKSLSTAPTVFDIMEEDIRNELDGRKYTFAMPEEDAETENNSAIADSSEELEYRGSENDTEYVLSDEQEEREAAVSRPMEEVTLHKNILPPQSNRAAPKGPYIIPTSLLEQYADDQYWIIDEETKADSIKLKGTLNQFGIEAEIIGIKKGPVVTMFELSPAPGVKLSKIVTLQDNIALNLAASSVRIVAPIPGRAAVGIEVPNKNRSIVSFREMIEQKLSEFEKMAVPVVLGKDILGKPQVLDLVKTPHMLIAGATGAGKSVCVNSMILSILYKRSPQQVKLILIDPKVVELKLYNDIPHLLTPVITEPKRALQSLQYCLCEMERRYALLDAMGVRDIASYNRRIDERNVCTEKLPYIVVIIDEFADLMATTGKELESTISRLAAMSRAVGIHLVLATQRPSIDVITGLIKANIPTRIAFMVASKMDSRIIIDQVGAEMLLGKGDMLYASAVDPFPVRIQGTFVSDQDVENVVEYVKTLGSPEYIDDEIFVDDDDGEEYNPSLFNDGPDPLYDQALDIVIQAGKASASYIQRRLKIGYNRAARLVEEMEERGIVGPANGSKPREVIHVPS